MFNKKNYILLIILLILIAGAYFYVVPYKDWQEEKEAGGDNFLADVDIKTVNKIEVTTKDGEVHTIEREEELWKYASDNWPTEKDLMDVLMEKLENIINLDWEIASVNPDKKISFQTDDSGLRVKLFQEDEEVANFIIGKISSSYNSTYISRDNNDNTYLVQETFVRAFDTESWQDKTIFNLDSSAINIITLKYPWQEIELTNVPDSRGEVYWRTIKPYVTRLNKEKTEELLNAVVKLEASDIPVQSEEGAGFDNPSLQLQLKGDDIDETIIIGGTGGEKGKEYFVKKVSDGKIFLISKSIKEKLFKQIKDLR